MQFNDRISRVLICIYHAFARVNNTHVAIPYRSVRSTIFFRLYANTFVTEQNAAHLRDSIVHTVRCIEIIMGNRISEYIYATDAEHVNALTRWFGFYKNASTGTARLGREFIMADYASAAA